MDTARESWVLEYYVSKPQAACQSMLCSSPENALATAICPPVWLALEMALAAEGNSDFSQKGQGVSR
jgi:hypothetical protein